MTSPQGEKLFHSITPDAELETRVSKQLEEDGAFAHCMAQLIDSRGSQIWPTILEV